MDLSAEENTIKLLISEYNNRNKTDIMQRDMPANHKVIRLLKHWDEHLCS